MSQTQMLLLTLGVVIVGIAVVGAITAYTQYGATSNFDKLTNEAIRISSMAQQWKSTPELFGGSPDDTKSQKADYEAFDFTMIGIEVVDDNPYCYENAEGQYGVIPADDGLWVFAASLSYENRVAFHVTGVTSESIAAQGGLSGDYLVVRDGTPVFAEGLGNVSVGTLGTCS